MAQDDRTDTNSDDIERRIEETRAGMDDTLEEIQSRLSPEYVTDQVIEYVRGPGGGRLARAIRDNPIAALLAAVGIGWLILSSLRLPEDDHYDDLDEDLLDDDLAGSGTAYDRVTSRYGAGTAGAGRYGGAGTFGDSYRPAAGTGTPSRVSGADYAEGGVSGTGSGLGTGGAGLGGAGSGSGLSSGTYADEPDQRDSFYGSTPGTSGRL